MEKRWNIDPADIKDDCVGCYLDKRWKQAKSVMDQRTRGHEFFEKISHNQSIYDDNGQIGKVRFSEGSTQAIKRKIRSQTIQRVPDGQITTQYDKNSIEQVEIEYIFQNKVLASEFDDVDRFTDLLRTFNAAYDHGYACVRTGFEEDCCGDIRTSYTLIDWNDVKPAPDCRFIEQARWYMVREYVSKSELEALIDETTGSVIDSTYNEDVVKYIIENDVKSGIDPLSMKLADKQNGVTPIESVEVRTMYERGAKEFVTYVPSIRAVLRTVKNYDPHKDVPIHFLILEPDPCFPLGVSSIMYTLSQQQFADAFQTTSYNTLLLAANPPIMGFGNLTPSAIKMRPRAFWPMGTNPNNKVEPFKVETTTLTQYGSILENVSANMQKNLNITDATIASDANVHGYSGTPQGVDMQQRDKTITVNQYQKRIEKFFANWANHALRSYLASMTGKQEMTVDEQTRRRIWDIEQAKQAEKSIIDGNKIEVDFDELSSDMLEFRVRTGSLIESEKETERKALQDLLVPVSQMMNAVSDANKPAFEQNIMQMLSRIFELSDIDISAQASARIDDKLVAAAVQATMEEVAKQGMQIQRMQQQIAPQGASTAEQLKEPMPLQEPMPEQNQGAQPLTEAQDDMMPVSAMPAPQPSDVDIAQ